MNLPLLRFMWLAHRLIRATVITFFVFAVRLSLAHFYPSRQSALRVPGFVCARRWKKGELEAHATATRQKYMLQSIYQVRLS